MNGNIDRVAFPKEKAYTLKELQTVLDSFNEESKPSAQGLLDFLEDEQNNR